MPCDQIRWQTVELGVAGTDLATLTKAAIALGYSVQQNGRALWLYGNGLPRGAIIDGGKIQIASGFEDRIPALKKEYSRQVTLRDARLARWNVTDLPDGTVKLSRRV